MGNRQCFEDTAKNEKMKMNEIEAIGLTCITMEKSVKYQKTLELNESFSENTSAMPTIPSPRENYEKYGPKCLSPQGWIYYGNFDFNGHKTGKGVFIWKDGSKYIGDWKSNMANGKGTLYYSDGDIYSGDWTNDMAHGKGKYIHTNGIIYEGDWVEDKQQGFGIETWPGGGCFKVNFVNDLKCGYGEFFWEDGSYYKG